MTTGPDPVKVQSEPGTPTLVRERVTPNDGSTALVWDDNVPGELRDAFQPYARWLAANGPRWLTRVYVSYDTAAPSWSSLCVQPDRSYNRVNVRISPSWIAQDAEARAFDVAHELVHFYSAPVLALVDQMRGHEWASNEDLRKIRNQQYEAADESFTEDMARLLVRYLPPVNV
jgi:hypothetical protein